MIGNLGRVAYSSLSNSNENNGNSGNITHKPAQILNQQKESLFSLHENRPGTEGTRMAKSTPVPTVPEGLNVNGNSCINENSIEKQRVIKAVPVVPAVPDKNHKICYWCKSTDFWQSRTYLDKWTCRRCHPPAPGAERRHKKEK